MSEFKLVTGTIAKATQNSGWYDLFATQEWRMYPGVVSQIPTGVRTQMSSDLRAKVEGKSGKALVGIEVHAGCIDADYKDEWFVICTLNLPTASLFDKIWNNPETTAFITKKQKEAFASVMDHGHLLIPAGTPIAQFKIERIIECGMAFEKDATFINSDEVRNGGLGSTEGHLAVLKHLAESRKFYQRVFSTDYILQELCGKLTYKFTTPVGEFTGTLKELISWRGSIEITNIAK